MSTPSSPVYLCMECKERLIQEAKSNTQALRRILSAYYSEACYKGILFYREAIDDKSMGDKKPMYSVCFRPGYQLGVGGWIDLRISFYKGGS